MYFWRFCLWWLTTFKPRGPQDQHFKKKGASWFGKGIMCSEASSFHTELLGSIRPASMEHLLYAKPWPRPKSTEIIPQGKKNNYCWAHALLLWAPVIPSAAAHLYQLDHTMLNWPFLLPSPPIYSEYLKERGYVLFIFASPLGQHRACCTMTLNKYLLNFNESLEIYIHRWLLTVTQKVGLSSTQPLLHWTGVFPSAFSRI